MGGDERCVWEWGKIRTIYRKIKHTRTEIKMVLTGKQTMRPHMQKEEKTNSKLYIVLSLSTNYGKIVKIVDIEEIG